MFIFLYRTQNALIKKYGYARKEDARDMYYTQFDFTFFLFLPFTTTVCFYTNLERDPDTSLHLSHCPKTITYIRTSVFPRDPRLLNKDCIINRFF